MSDKTIVVIGDSNTEGYGLNDMKETYPYKLEQILNDSSEHVVKIHNMGISGTCILNQKLVDGTVIGMPYVHQDKYQEALAIDADIFIINLGTNDAQDGLDDFLDIVYPESNLIACESSFKSDYLKILHDIKESHPSAKILICSPVPVKECIWRKHQQKYLDRLLPYIQEIAHEQDVIHVDLFLAFVKLNIDGLYQDDGLHLNDSGTSLVANLLAPVLISMM